MSKLLSSSTFQLIAIILFIGLLGIAYSDLEWSLWFEQAKFYVWIYAGKEGFKYGSQAYKEKSG